MITGVLDDLVMLGFGGMSIPTLEAIEAGDTVEIDNSDYLAAQTYHRHQDPGPEYPVWDQFKAPDGTHLYPQRPMVEGYDQVGKGNSWQSGRFTCKVITVNCLMDEAAFPWQADWYRHAGDRRARPRLPRPLPALVRRPGDARQPQPLPVAQRGPRSPSRATGPTDTQIVAYNGVLHQALRDVAAWAERGVEPPARDQLPRRRRPDRGAADGRRSRWRAAGRDAHRRRRRPGRRGGRRGGRARRRRRGAAGRRRRGVGRVGLRRLGRLSPTPSRSPTATAAARHPHARLRRSPAPTS